MALEKKKNNSALGRDPLKTNVSKGIFSKTETAHPSAEVVPLNKSEEDPNFQESRIENQESRFLKNSEREKVNLRLPIELNDWLDDLVKKGKRIHGRKIAKEIWVQAALEYFRSLPINWEEVESVERLRDELHNEEKRIKKKESRKKNQDS